MDFIGGALPNVMFLIGVIAIGIGFGLEFKIVEVKGQLSRSARIGVITSGILLITVSVFLYLRPDAATSTAGTIPAATSVIAPVNGSANLLVASTTTAPSPEVAGAPPTTAESVATTALPTASVQVNGSLIQVPDIRGKNLDEAQQSLITLGLQLGTKQSDCEQVGPRQEKGKPKKGQVLCQSPAPNTAVAPGTTIAYVLAEDNKKKE